MSLNLDCDPAQIHTIQRSPTIIQLAILSKYYPCPQISFKVYSLVSKAFLPDQVKPLLFDQAPINSVTYNNQIIILFKDFYRVISLKDFQYKDIKLLFSGVSICNEFIFSQLGELYHINTDLSLTKLGKTSQPINCLRVDNRLFLISKFKVQLYQYKTFQGEEVIDLVQELAVENNFSWLKNGKIFVCQNREIFLVQEDLTLQKQSDIEGIVTSAYEDAMGTVSGQIYYNQSQIAQAQGCIISCSQYDDIVVSGSDLLELIIWSQ